MRKASERQIGETNEQYIRRLLRPTPVGGVAPLPNTEDPDEVAYRAARLDRIDEAHARIEASLERLHDRLNGFGI